jgi:alkanesulfonate monooxygenase SsuD/methylene tetrahydromethanopterin reductase-like flavin-dependent oxidoreductase (luciferase family)
MRVGVGLPSGVPGASGRLVIEWAARADAGPFSSVACIDRLVYDAFDPIAALAAAAAVTRRVALAAMVISAPMRNTAMLAKAAASVDALSGGRLVLGLAIGARHEDYDVAGIEHRDRGRRFSQQVAELRDWWTHPKIGPRPARPGGPLLLVGGLSDEAYARAARFADGYAHSGGPPRAFARAADRARAAWIDAGRPDRPLLWGQGYFALGGAGAADAGARYLLDYYAFAGPFAERIAAGQLTSPQAVAEFARAYEEAGCDELVLFPAVADLAQVDLLADALAAHREPV